MFCPICGRDNSRERRFCVSCGTNLEAVSQALAEGTDDFFTKTDAALDQLIARYADHVFKDAPANATDRKVGNSWKLLGQGVLTSFVDMILFSLMWNVLPLRFLMLLISTPIRLLSQRSKPGRHASAGVENQRKLAASASVVSEWLPGSAPSISEHTTEHLDESKPARRNRIPDRER
jgi:hypothetical protein